MSDIPEGWIWVSGFGCGCVAYRFLLVHVFGPEEEPKPYYQPTTHYCTVCGHGTYESTKKCPGCGEDFTGDGKDESPCQYCGSQWSHDDEGNCKHCGAHE